MPLAFALLKVKYNNFFLNGTAALSLGLYSQSVWMPQELLPLALEHTVRHTKCSKEDHILLVLDNHESHVSIGIISKEKDSCVSLFTFPPHRSHRLQPLVALVFPPLKFRYKVVCDDWLLKKKKNREDHHNSQRWRACEISVHVSSGTKEHKFKFLKDWCSPIQERTHPR